EPGPDDEPRPRQVVLRRIGEQVPPARVGRPDAEPEEREAGLGQDEVRDDQAGVDDDWSGQVWQDVRADDSPVVRSHHPRGFDEHHPDRRQQRDLERYLRAVEQAQKLILAERVARAENEQRVVGLTVLALVVDPGPGTGGLQLVRDGVGADEEVVRAVAEEVPRDRRADEGDQDQEDDEHAARDGDAIALEAAPDELPVAACVNGLELTELRPALGCDRGAEPGGTGNDELSLLHRRNYCVSASAPATRTWGNPWFPHESPPCQWSSRTNVCGAGSGTR